MGPRPPRLRTEPLATCVGCFKFQTKSNFLGKEKASATSQPCSYGSNPPTVIPASSAHARQLNTLALYFF